MFVQVVAEGESLSVSVRRREDDADALVWGDDIDAFTAAQIERGLRSSDATGPVAITVAADKRALIVTYATAADAEADADEVVAIVEDRLDSWLAAPAA